MCRVKNVAIRIELNMWLNLAAAQGQPVAKIELDRLASKMTSGQVAEAQRLARQWKPSTPPR
jgi:hypothetical protein